MNFLQTRNFQTSYPVIPLTKYQTDYFIHLLLDKYDQYSNYLLAYMPAVNDELQTAQQQRVEQNFRYIKILQILLVELMNIYFKFGYTTYSALLKLT